MLIRFSKKSFKNLYVPKPAKTIDRKNINLNAKSTFKRVNKIVLGYI